MGYTHVGVEQLLSHSHSLTSTRGCSPGVLSLFLFLSLSLSLSLLSSLSLSLSQVLSCPIRKERSRSNHRPHQTRRNVRSQQLPQRSRGSRWFAERVDRGTEGRYPSLHLRAWGGRTAHTVCVDHGCRDGNIWVLAADDGDIRTGGGEERLVDGAVSGERVEPSCTHPRIGRPMPCLQRRSWQAHLYVLLLLVFLLFLVERDQQQGFILDARHRRRSHGEGGTL